MRTIPVILKHKGIKESKVTASKPISESAVVLAEKMRNERGKSSVMLEVEKMRAQAREKKIELKERELAQKDEELALLRRQNEVFKELNELNTNRIFELEARIVALEQRVR